MTETSLPDEATPDEPEHDDVYEYGKTDVPSEGVTVLNEPSVTTTSED